MEDGCPKLTTCKYRLFSEEKDNETLYGYYFVFNEKYSCQEWCPDRLDYMSCPANNTGCQIDDTIKNKCSIFHCYNVGNFVMFIICLIVLIPSVILSLVMIAYAIIQRQRPREPERFPLYAS